MSFTPEALRQVLSDHGSPAGYVVAYSGGLDSHVLLHALAALRDRLAVPVRAVHVNHNLSPGAAGWAQHCRRVCEAVDVELDCPEIRAAAPAGESQEAWSRKLRYEAFARILDKDEVLLTAHQADDQAETLLLQLLRGCGPDGLAAMPVFREFARGYHARPLLRFERRALFEYAQNAGLDWIEDESNTDTRFDRNFLRRSIMPLLAERWPAVSRTLGRSAGIQAETAQLLAELGAMDLEETFDPVTKTLAVARVFALSPARRRNVVRQWLHRLGFPVPDSTRLQAIINEVLPAREDARPCVAWNNTEVRRYQGRLYAMASLPDSAAGSQETWSMQQPLELPLGMLSSETVTGSGIRADACKDHAIHIGFRSGGEVIRRPGHQCHQELKKLLQEHHVPPWWRPYIPLVFIDDELASVAGIWEAEAYAARGGEAGVRIHWTEAGKVFGGGPDSV